MTTLPMDSRGVVIGLGSIFLGDAGVGIRVVRLVANRLSHPVRVVESHAGGLLLLEEMMAADRVVIVDAVLDASRKPGDLILAGIDGVGQHTACAHDCSLSQAVALGRAMGLPLPANHCIHLLTIVVETIDRFSDVLNAPIAAALPTACNIVEQWLTQEEPPGAFRMAA